MKLKNDFVIDLATGHSRMSKKWRNRQWQWSELVERCRETRRTGETAAEYARMSREEQSNVKDVGGFVGGYLAGGVRKNTGVLYRTVATLDIDYGTPDVWDDFTTAFGFAAMLYSTHKHSAEHPRYRLVFPLSRQVKPAEYEPLCRKIADGLGMDLFDDTTYELPRLFYWPSTSKDAEYVFEYQDGPACNVDSVLAQYTDYRDVSAWPMSSREGDVVAHLAKKAGDPTEKPGIIGAFCRAYGIEDVIADFLSDVYEPTAMPGRYTYKSGSVSGGLMCYEGKYAYSHHETDPAGKQLSNAFDLCRIHLFGVKDEGTRTADVTRRPSYQAMLELCARDKNVRLLMARERRASAADDFAEVEPPEGYTDDWKAELEYTKSGKLISNVSNIMLILENDPALAGKIRTDLFSGFDTVCGPLPWNAHATVWTDRDDANLRVWMEKNYDITGKDKINDAMAAVLTRHCFHPIRDYLDGLHWDGTPRLEHLVIDYIGAADTEINRVMTRKHFTAAVARIFQPGVKYDQCLILTGPEGAGKSTLLGIMGGKWFNDSVTTTEGKEGMDQLRRSWIIELGELSSIRRSDVESVKAFLSKQTDIYRAAYDRRTAEHPRQCVFCGTTNETHFLKGDTGNRRFWVISVDPALRRHKDWKEALVRDRDQLWAEAVAGWKRGERLYLEDEAMEAQARRMQAEFNDDSDDPMQDMLTAYLDRKLPPDWGLKDIRQRREWLRDAGGDPTMAAGTEVRTRVCAAEFICEALGKEMTDKDYKYLARKVCKMIAKTPGWAFVGTSRHAEKLYGRQRSFVRDVNKEANLSTEDTNEL
ncbi:MAG: virulence-associated E family protein [Bacteroidales bacterium]|nr:virulence-associated E family protein [Bacteroidales bacterium]MCM1148099.1 virulence-associated E family protein [Bacteroidales bacterium]MCM1509445.1 virulence-associated E family protein [Clostridium sp.]